MQKNQNPQKPYSAAARLIALIVALIVIAGTIFVVFQPAKNAGGPASVIPTAYADAGDWKDLKKGASGEKVKRAQAALQALGFWGGKIDGNFSRAFEEAVVAFQMDWGLTANGVIDRDAFELITADLPETLPSATPDPKPTANAPNTVKASPVPPAAAPEEPPFVEEGASYTDKDHVAAYLHAFGKLPPNYITKKEATALGWVNSWGNLWDVAPGKSIGGDYFSNFERQLPTAKGRSYYECDIDYGLDREENRGRRNGKRIVYSSDGLIFYTGDHYETFTEITFEGGLPK